MDDVIEFPKVERIVSSEPISVSQAANFLSKFVAENQRKLPSSITRSVDAVASSPWSSLSSPSMAMTAVDHTVWDDLQNIVRSMRGGSTAATLEHGTESQTPQANNSLEDVAAASEKDSESKSRKKKDKKKKEKKSKADKAEKREKKRKRESAGEGDDSNQKTKQKHAKNS